ncbi:MAG: beta-aspartyl-peptidase [Faecalicatena sp.]|nr:beta-aspartyl-peptidase [Faecalicatena sp.]MCI6466234.1 beta-aspartyl-peptidase [Faecalicatena sp.]MDY5620934.1 beta-aspartyl-peptidase [Lachnospiraceae bacterium]
MLLIKNAEVYAPEYVGRKDVLVCGEKIECIADEIDRLPVACHILNGKGLKLVPGLIDQHVHVTGGGGEGGFHTRTPELQLSELISSGITTVVGLLGTDGTTRSVENLYAKTAALNEEGVTAYMLTGAYGYPSPTITGAADKDVIFIESVLGMKLAISDHRSPHVTIEELIQIASKIRVAGMLSRKPGILVLHMGDARSGLTPVIEAIERSSVPIRTFRPTHVNRNADLLEAGYEFVGKGGYIDFTCGMEGQPSPGECIVEARRRGLAKELMTVSSDGHGSWSNYAQDGTLLEIGVSKVDSMLQELQKMVKELSVPLEEALLYFTSNVAEAMDIGNRKGHIREGADADMILLDADLNLDTVIAKGQVMMEDKRIKKFGTYEHSK